MGGFKRQQKVARNRDKSADGGLQNALSSMKKYFSKPPYWWPLLKKTFYFVLRITPTLTGAVLTQNNEEEKAKCTLLFKSSVGRGRANPKLHLYGKGFIGFSFRYTEARTIFFFHIALLWYLKQTHSGTWCQNRCHLAVSQNGLCYYRNLKSLMSR